MSIDLVWTVSHPTLTGAERCTVHGTDEGWVLAGVVVAVLEGRPIDVRYRVTVDELWVTRTVSVAADELGKAARLDLVRSNTGTWTVDGQAAPELDGCVDVDLGITPVTNTLPIRRLDLEVGAEQEIDVAWVRFPHLRVERGRQRYARLAPETWRYSSQAFTADLAVDENGLVVRYGHDLWRRVEGAR
jgi:hypothetical protein